MFLWLERAMDPSISPGPDTRFAPTYLISCGVLAAVALGLCSTRIYTRVRPVPHLTLDDYLIVVAEVCLADNPDECHDVTDIYRPSLLLVTAWHA